MCGESGMAAHFTYSEPPPLETRFPLAKGERYWRELYRCGHCGHYVECLRAGPKPALCG